MATSRPRKGSFIMTKSIQSTMDNDNSAKALHRRSVQKFYLKLRCNRQKIYCSLLLLTSSVRRYFDLPRYQGDHDLYFKACHVCKGFGLAFLSSIILLYRTCG